MYCTYRIVSYLMCVYSGGFGKVDDNGGVSASPCVCVSAMIFSNRKILTHSEFNNTTAATAAHNANFSY